jgi:hypothetical protein
MDFGTWYLASADGDLQATGDLHPVGACELTRRLHEVDRGPTVVLDGGEFEKGLIEVALFLEVLGAVRNVGGHAVVIDARGPMANFLAGLGSAAPVPVARSLEAALALVGGGMPTAPRPF